MTDYEIPISTKSGAIAKPRNQMESMYVAMDGASVQKPLDSDTPDFIDSFETYASSEPDSERYAVHKVGMYYTEHIIIIPYYIHVLHTTVVRSN